MSSLIIDIRNYSRGYIGRIAIVLTIAMIIFSGIALAVEQGNNPLVEFDVFLANWLHHAATNPLTLFFKGVTLFGQEGMALIGVTGTVYLTVRGKWAQALVWALAFLGAIYFPAYLKDIFDRSRPVFSNPIYRVYSSSFPSGHTMGAAVAYAMLAYGIQRHLDRPAARATLLALTAAIMLLVGFSRLYLGAHYFSDVVASFTLASAWVTVCITALHVLDTRGAFKQPEPMRVPVPVETYTYQPRIDTELYRMPR